MPEGLTAGTRSSPRRSSSSIPTPRRTRRWRKPEAMSTGSWGTESDRTTSPVSLQRVQQMAPRLARVEIMVGGIARRGRLADREGEPSRILERTHAATLKSMRSEHGRTSL